MLHASLGGWIVPDCSGYRRRLLVPHHKIPTGHCIIPATPLHLHVRGTSKDVIPFDPSYVCSIHILVRRGVDGG